MKNTKKILALVLALVLSVSMLAGCGSSNSSSEPSVEESSSAPAAPASGQLSAVHQAVKDAYGENYLPSMPLDEVMLQEMYGVDPALVKEFAAEIPMISAHVDTFIGIEAVEGKGEEVETALNAYRDVLVADTMQYPQNIAKIQASTVLRNGDYVFFVMLGAINEDMEADEASALEFAQAEMQKGIDAIENTLQ